MKLITLLGLLIGLNVVAAPPSQDGSQYVAIGRIPPVSLSKGTTHEALVTVKVRPGFHVQANPASNPQLIPTKLELEGRPGITVGTPVYPTGKPYRLQGSPTEIATYDGTFVVKVPLTQSGPKVPQDFTLTGKLKFQACNDKICFFPTNVPVHVPVRTSTK